MIIWTAIEWTVKTILKATGLRFWIGFLLGLAIYAADFYYSDERLLIQIGKQQIEAIKKEAVENKENLETELKRVQKRKKEIERQEHEDIIDSDTDLDSVIEKYRHLSQ